MMRGARLELHCKNLNWVWSGLEFVVNEEYFEDRVVLTGLRTVRLSETITGHVKAKFLYKF